MPSAPLPPEKRAEIEDLERAIREAVDAEIGALAENLATTDDAHLFGANESVLFGRPRRASQPQGKRSAWLGSICRSPRTSWHEKQ